MTERCEMCRWWTRDEPNAYGYPPKSGQCRRFPRAESTPEDYGCGEHPAVRTGSITFPAGTTRLAGTLNVAGNVEVHGAKPSKTGD